MITIGSNIRSIMVPQGKWQVDLYGEEGFVGDSETIRHDTGSDILNDRNDCINIPYSLSGQVNSIRFSNQYHEGLIPAV